MTAFDRALELVLRFEDGYVDDPSDPGGATNRGITQRTYDSWRRNNNLPLRSVRAIEEHEIQAIYYHLYWLPGRCDELHEIVAIAHFDACVNLGVEAAAKVLQRAVAVEDDGIIGPVTLSAVRRIAPLRLLDHMLWQRVRYYRRITTDESNALVQLARAVRAGTWSEARRLVDKAEGIKFIRWWIHRVLTLRKELVGR